MLYGLFIWTKELNLFILFCRLMIMENNKEKKTVKCIEELTLWCLQMDFYYFFLSSIYKMVKDKFNSLGHIEP